MSPHREDYRADLHTHTNCSDGLCTPEELLEEAQWRGLSCIGLTDHDTMKGTTPALRAGAERGIEVIHGVELSCVHKDQEIHILGYLIRDTESVENACEDVRRHRQDRMRIMVERACEQGLDLAYEEVESEAQGETVGRPHMARVMFNKGIVKSINEAFEKYIGDKGRITVPKKRFTPAAAIEIITSARGIPVLAHPGVSHADNMIEDFIDMGIRGIEVYYTAHTPEQEGRYASIAKKHNLIITGGSDYHGDPTHGRQLGQPTVGATEVEALRNLHAKLYRPGSTD